MSSRGLLAPGSKKLKSESEKSKESRKRVEVRTFRLFFDSDFNFFGPWGRKAPGNSFSTRFPTLGPKGPKTPLGGLKARNTRRASKWTCQISRSLGSVWGLCNCKAGKVQASCCVHCVLYESMSCLSALRY